MSERHGIISAGYYISVGYYTSADLRPTRGRTISLANHAHAPEGIMSEGHGIISLDIIPALICFRPKGEKFLQRIMCISRWEYVRRPRYNFRE